MISRRLVLGGAVATTALSALRHGVAAETPAVAAAADLQDALPEIVALFAHAGGASVALSFGSSGNITTQIEQGAPFEVFLSADESYVQKLRAAGKTQGDPVLYAIGRIGEFQPAASPIHADSRLADLGAALRDGRLHRFAIANPAHAPYGRAAQQALQHAGLWDAIQGSLVLGENVSQATQYAMGAAQGGIIPLSLALSPKIRAAGAFALIDAGWHKPLRQGATLLKGASPTARQFFAFLDSREARAVFDKYGFVRPGPAGDGA